MLSSFLHRRHGVLRPLAAVLGLLGAGFAAASPSVYPEGTTRLDPARGRRRCSRRRRDGARSISMAGSASTPGMIVGGFASTLIAPALVQGQRGHVLVTLENASGRGVDPGAGPGRCADLQHHRRRRSATARCAGSSAHGAPCARAAARRSGTIGQRPHRWYRPTCATRCRFPAARRCSTTSSTRSTRPAPSSGAGWRPSTWKNSASSADAPGP